MPNLVNLEAETGAALVGDDTGAVLTLKNTTAGPALRLESTPAANTSIGVALQLSANSGASAALVGLINNAFVSAVSIVFAASANWAGLGVARVARTDGTFGWVPILPDAVVTAAAVA
jgi:hypothetical protein